MLPPIGGNVQAHFPSVCIWMTQYVRRGLEHYLLPDSYDLGSGPTSDGSSPLPFRRKPSLSRSNFGSADSLSGDAFGLSFLSHGVPLSLRLRDEPGSRSNNMGSTICVCIRSGCAITATSSTLADSVLKNTKPSWSGATKQGKPLVCRHCNRSLPRNVPGLETWRDYPRSKYHEISSRQRDSDYGSCGRPGDCQALTCRNTCACASYITVHCGTRSRHVRAVTGASVRIYTA